MTKIVVEPICSKCKRVIPFAIPYDDFNFCAWCSEPLTDDIKAEFSYPKCSQEIQEGHCEECESQRLKACDNCGSYGEVEYRPQFEHKCLCKSCRYAEALARSCSRSW